MSSFDYPLGKSRKMKVFTDELGIKQDTPEHVDVSTPLGVSTSGLTPSFKTPTPNVGNSGWISEYKAAYTPPPKVIRSLVFNSYCKSCLISNLFYQEYYLSFESPRHGGEIVLTTAKKGMKATIREALSRRLIKCSDGDQSSRSSIINPNSTLNQ